MTVICDGCGVEFAHPSGHNCPELSERVLLRLILMELRAQNKKLTDPSRLQRVEAENERLQRENDSFRTLIDECDQVRYRLMLERAKQTEILEQADKIINIARANHMNEFLLDEEIAKYDQLVKKNNET